MSFMNWFFDLFHKHSWKLLNEGELYTAYNNKATVGNYQNYVCDCLKTKRIDFIAPGQSSLYLYERPLKTDVVVPFRPKLVRSKS